jgi:hypothetical protein
MRRHAVAGPQFSSYFDLLAERHTLDGVGTAKPFVGKGTPPGDHCKLIECNGGVCGSQMCQHGEQCDHGDGDPRDSGEDSQQGPQ